MKELSIEEKARAYDKAIEKIKYVMEHGVSPVLNKEDLQGIFPELAESEDERIRKMCMRYLDREYQHCPFADDKKNIEKCIAWLEKQGEQKPTLRERYKNIAESEWFKKTHEGMSVSDDEKVDNVNKIEPKFKVGDWVINRTNATIMQIINNKDFYESVEIGGQRRIDYYNYLEWDFRLWTIQDAKDGDILCTPNGNTFIFKTIDGDKILDYCGLYFNKFFSDSGSPNGSSTHYDKCNYHPATKEQRDLLFAKMKEAGYEWDAEKKELKKFDFSKPIKYNSNPPSIVKESDWSEEDEKMVANLVDYFKVDDALQYTEKQVVDWLKSLKGRAQPQPKQEWSEEDQNALEDVREAVVHYWGGDTQDILLYWLKKLKQRNRR